MWGAGDHMVTTAPDVGFPGFEIQHLRFRRPEESRKDGSQPSQTVCSGIRRAFSAQFVCTGSLVIDDFVNQTSMPDATELWTKLIISSVPTGIDADES
jgi:hypothetical protein